VITLGGQREQFAIRESDSMLMIFCWKMSVQGERVGEVDEKIGFEEGA